MAESYHELDPDGDLVLILDPSSLGYRSVEDDARSEGMVKLNRLEVRYHFG